jgi:hypothetical protein
VEASASEDVDHCRPQERAVQIVGLRHFHCREDLTTIVVSWLAVQSS